MLQPRFIKNDQDSKTLVLEQKSMFRFLFISYQTIHLVCEFDQILLRLEFVHFGCALRFCGCFGLFVGQLADITSGFWHQTTIFLLMGHRYGHKLRYSRQTCFCKQQLQKFLGKPSAGFCWDSTFEAFNKTDTYDQALKTSLVSKYILSNPILRSWKEVT